MVFGGQGGFVVLGVLRVWDGFGGFFGRFRWFLEIFGWFSEVFGSFLEGF